MKRMSEPLFRLKRLAGLPSGLNTLTRCALNVSFWPKTWNVPALTLIAWSVPLCMPELLSEIAAHAALFGAGGTACGATMGRIEPGVDREALGRLGTALDFIGTPGADNTAAGRVTDTGSGIVILLAAAAAGALVAELAVPEVPGAVGTAAGCATDVTVAVIE